MNDLILGLVTTPLTSLTTFLAISWFVLFLVGFDNRLNSYPVLKQFIDDVANALFFGLVVGVVLIIKG